MKTEEFAVIIAATLFLVATTPCIGRNIDKAPIGSASTARGVYVDDVDGDVARDQQVIHRLDTLFSLPYVSGVAIYLPWADVESSPGRYNWSLFDALIRIAASHHKHAAIGLCVASFAPQWVKDRVATFTFTHPNTHVGVKTAPVPWDSVYVKYEKDAIAHMGQRYNGNPTIAYVEMTGPSTLFGVETNWPMKRNTISAPDIAKLEFTPDKYVAAWKEMIRTYYGHFDRTKLGLALNNQFGIDDVSEAEGTSIAERIRDFAIASHPANGTKLAVRLLGLSDPANDRWFNGGCNGGQGLTRYMALAFDVRSRVDVQFQMGSVDRTAGYTPQQFARAMQIGMSCGASVVEVKSPDVWMRGKNAPYEPFRRALIDAQSALGGR